ncbi:Universal stress protein E [Frankliniella fusca]|uniref:Universal stress protein E n=1 Tax=Frankliniella fusca TaxID=407009 RepID=A0AAE1GSA0_9NEOP|nr:Universal stress protein E [Frankliniella fusca]
MLLWKPVFGTQLAPPLLSSLPGCFVGAAPYWMFHQEHLVTKMDQVLMSCDNVLEEKHKTKHAGLLKFYGKCEMAAEPVHGTDDEGWCPRLDAGVFSLGILGSTGCRSSTQGPAAKSQVFKLRCLQRLGCERCHLGQQWRSKEEYTQQ